MRENKIQRFTAKHAFITALLGVIVLYYILFGLVFSLTKYMLPPLEGSIADSMALIVGVLVYSLLLILIFRCAYPLSLLGLRRQGLGYGSKLALLGLVCSSLPIFLIWFLPEITAPISITATGLLGMVSVLFLAFQEELLFRGVILTVLMQGMGNSRAGIYRALLWSGLFFGLAHIAPSGIPTSGFMVLSLSKIITSLSFGVFSGAIFLRSGNLWAAALLHGLSNVLFFLPGFLQNGDYSFTASYSEAYADARAMGLAEILVPELIWPVVLSLPLLILGLWLARKAPLTVKEEAPPIVPEEAAE